MSDFTKILPRFIRSYTNVTDTLSVAQVTSQLNNVNTSLNIVFDTISGTLKSISPTLGGLTVDVQTALTKLKLTTIQLVQAISNVSSQNLNDYEQVTKNIGSVTLNAEELMKAVSAVAATFAIENESIMEAVSALCIVLYTALKVVLHVVVTISDLLAQLTSDVFHGLQADITMLTNAIKSINTILLSQSHASMTGKVSGLTSNISYISTSLAEMCSKFSANFSI